MLFFVNQGYMLWFVHNLSKKKMAPRFLSPVLWKLFPKSWWLSNLLNPTPPPSIYCPLRVFPSLPLSPLLWRTRCVRSCCYLISLLGGCRVASASCHHFLRSSFPGSACFFVCFFRAVFLCCRFFGWLIGWLVTLVRCTMVVGAVGWRLFGR